MDSQLPLHPDKPSDGYLKYCIVSGVLLLFATASVAFRFVQRLRASEIWWDDWTILIALICGLGVFITNILITIPSIGAAGYHIYEYEIAQLNTWAKLGLAAEVLYNPSISFSKLSILFYYRRIFSIDGQFLMFMYIMFFLTFGFCVSAVFGLIFANTPIEGQWNLDMPSKSINGPAFWVSSAAINMGLDVAILIIAQIKLWHIKLDLKRKLLLSPVFLLGVFTIITSAIRIWYLTTVDLTDPTYTLTNAGIWYNVELFLSIIVACLPVIYTLYRTRHGQRSANDTANSFSKNTSGKRILSPYGSAPSKFTGASHNDESGLGSVANSNYQVLCEPDGDTYSMEPLDPIRVRTEYEVR